MSAGHVVAVAVAVTCSCVTTLLLFAVLPIKMITLESSLPQPYDPFLPL